MNTLFQEAISHCRWKTVLRDHVLKIIDISEYNNKTFEQIFINIHEICSKVRGIGMLCTYDICAALCRLHGVHIDRVYIIGGGPRRAVQLLNLKLHVHVLNESIKLQYVHLCDVNESLGEQFTDGDSAETHLCRWQKKPCVLLA